MNGLCATAAAQTLLILSKRWLNENQLSGLMPVGISELVNLWELSVVFYSVISDLTFPRNLVNNKLSGAIPEGMSTLAKLRNL